MKLEQMDAAYALKSKIDALRYELNHVNDLLANADGLLTVKINTRWIIQIQAGVIKGQAQARKAQIEQDLAAIEATLSAL